MVPVGSGCHLNPLKSSQDWDDVSHQIVPSIQMGFTSSGGRSLMSDDCPHFASSTWRYPNDEALESERRQGAGLASLNSRRAPVTFGDTGVSDIGWLP